MLRGFFMRGRRFSTLYAPRCPARCPFPGPPHFPELPPRSRKRTPEARPSPAVTARRPAGAAPSWPVRRVSAPRDPAFSAGPRQMTAALPWSAPPPETVRAEPTGWRETSDQPRVRGAWSAPDPRIPGTAPLRGMPRSTPPHSLGQTLVNDGSAKTMRLDMQNVRLLRIRAESAPETVRVAPSNRRIANR